MLCMNVALCMIFDNMMMLLLLIQYLFTRGCIWYCEASIPDAGLYEDCYAWPG